MELSRIKLYLITLLLIVNVNYGLSQMNANDSSVFDTLYIQTENIDLKCFKEIHRKTYGESRKTSISVSFTKSLPPELYAEAKKMNKYSFKLYVQFNLKSDGTIRDAMIIKESENKSFNMFISNHLDELIRGMNTSKKPLFFNNQVGLFRVPVSLDFK